MKRLMVTLGALMLFVATVSPLAQSKNMTAQEQANLKVVTDWWKDVIQAGHVDLAEKYQAEDYIQHNPGISTGRAAFVAVFGRRAPRDIQPALNPAPIIQFAKGPYVVLVWERTAKDEMMNDYKYNFFDVVRVENGKVAEHWDSVFKNPPNPNQPAPGPVVPGIGPKPVKPANSADEQKVEDIANVEFKDILQYGHIELAEKVMAPGYIQHNPNVPSGRDGFVNFFKGRNPVEPIKKEWKNEPELIITSGDLTLYMMKRFSADPVDPTKVYKWNWFDMVRVGNGMIQEHWDMATKPGQMRPAPMQVPMPAGFKEYR